VPPHFAVHAREERLHSDIQSRLGTLRRSPAVRIVDHASRGVTSLGAIRTELRTQLRPSLFAL
jgi:hypothetical protein